MARTEPLTDSSVSLLVDCRNLLGESATWCEQSRALYWTDIEGARLWRYDAGNGLHKSWSMPKRLACIALTGDPDVLLLGLETCLSFFNVRTLAFQHIVDVEPELPTRINDGRCDRTGAFVFGMKDEGGDVAPRQIGSFYRLNHDLTLERLSLPAAAIANSISFSPDGARMYFCDSPTREIKVCDYGADGKPCNERPFVRLGGGLGEPDGSCVDCDGGVWNAQWGAGCVVRYDSTGAETDRVHVPVGLPTCVALDGNGRLYVTSARSENEGAEVEPGISGGVFIAQTARAGLVEPRFPFTVRTCPNPPTPLTPF
jgi:L-arabinonolactonase